MRLVGGWVGAVVLISGLAAASACGGGVVAQPAGGGPSNPGGSGGSGGGSGGGDGSPDGGTGSTGGGSTGSDGGTGGQTGGSPDGGSDGGSTGGQDGGTGGTDGGTGVTPLHTITFPTNHPDWQFYGPQHGGPQDVYDSSMDEGGNLWVAGGVEGLFLMRSDGHGGLSGRFEKFGIADGLHPYGWINGDVAKAMGVLSGTPADPNPSLSATPVISVAGGPAGTVFVGYQGKPGCEDEWDAHGATFVAEHAKNNAAVYKSGDADRVTLSGSGISVVHYDIFSGPGVVPNEVPGREKICTVYRIVWDKARNAVWFGANHGFAVAAADAPNAPTCDGEPACSPVWEHSHPAISGCSVDYDLNSGFCPSDKTTWVTDAYFGVAVDPTNHDMWMGGSNRTTKFHSGNGNYYAAQNDTENNPGPCSTATGMCDRWDLWPDNQPEWDSRHGVIYVSPLMRSTPGATKPDFALDDAVSGIAAMSNGTAWVGSFAHGLIHIDSYGSHLGDATSKLMSKYVSSVAADPQDGSVWAGMQWGLGITRLDASGNAVNYSYGPPLDPGSTLGDKLANAPVGNIQGVLGPNGRRMVAAFHRFTMTDPTTKAKVDYAGAVAVYSGP